MPYGFCQTPLKVSWERSSEQSQHWCIDDTSMTLVDDTTKSDAGDYHAESCGGGWQSPLA